MLFRLIKRMIECGQKESISPKIDIFFAAGKLTENEYMQILSMLS